MFQKGKFRDGTSLRALGSHRDDAFGILLCMRRLTWITMGMLCITAAAQQPAAPVSVGIVFDTSGSMGAKLGRSRQMAAQFLKAADSQDEFFLIEFNDRPALASAFTTETYKIQDHLVFIQSKGRSALWDAVYLALSEIKKGQHPRKALLVISDGGDNSSHYTENEMKKLVREAGNDNVVLIEMIETLDGALAAREIAAIPGVTAIFAASGDLGNFSGYKQGTPDYERLINIVHDAALGAGKRLCGPFAWRDRPDFTCFQNASETAAIARGVAAELGPLKDTQGKPEVGPYAPKK